MTKFKKSVQDLTTAELAVKASELALEIAKLRLELATGRLQNKRKIFILRKQLAIMKSYYENSKR
ncbi:MAG: 50S ribosomal protein L29 [Patescibacteria group bacterium]